MSAAGTAVRARLLAHSGTYALVKKRVYPLRLPQGPKYPAIRYQVISAPRTHLMGGDSGEVHSRVQVDCYAETYSGAHELAVQVRAALSRWGGTSGGVAVEHVFLDDERDVLEPTIEVDGDRGLYRVMLDFIVHYGE